MSSRTVYTGWDRTATGGLLGAFVGVCVATPVGVASGVGVEVDGDEVVGDDVAGRDGGVDGLATVGTGPALDGPRGDEQPANTAVDSPARSAARRVRQPGRSRNLSMPDHPVPLGSGR
jgi:hypothetical protein